MYTLHIANKLYSSWSLRPWILMRECTIPFVEQLRPFVEGSSREVFQAFSPTGKVPCLHTEQAQVIWDSLAIAEFLAERHAGVWPKDAQARAWARCAAAEMHSGFQALRQHCSMHCGLRIKLHSVPQAVQDDIDRIAALWVEGVRRFGGPFLAGGTFTAVDAFFAPVVLRFQTYGIPLSGAAQAYSQQVLGQASLREWVDAAVQEPWLEPAHEQEVLAMGKVVQDLRHRP